MIIMLVYFSLLYILLPFIILSHYNLLYLYFN